MPKFRQLPEKPCATCGKMFGRRLFSNGRYEDANLFLRRKHCSLSCGNTRREVGFHGNSWRARNYLQKGCELCGSTRRLTAHHCDEDRTNNSADNIQTLCGSCHAWWHHEARRRGLHPCGKALPRAPRVGWPTGWTGFASAATASSPSRPPARSRSAGPRSATSNTSPTKSSTRKPLSKPSPLASPAHPAPAPEDTAP